MPDHPSTFLNTEVPHISKDMGLDIIQPRDGYRFSVDSLLLARFCRIRPQDSVLDLGTGCGIIALTLASMHPEISITAVEIQEELIKTAVTNVKNNGFQHRIKVIQGDLNNISHLIFAQCMDHVVSNPPYRHPVSGRICKNSMDALARHEILTNIRQVINAARYVLRPGGRFSLIFPAERLAELISLLVKNRLEPKRLQMVHPSNRQKARMCLVEACRDAGHELHVLPPIFLNQK